ncbi:cell envelope integrity protein TolA [Acinetobacter gyllenbergii]|uniref:cell envelope integrity protein TolA n=1 Tax=Acinetobacter gyllenbergii TaxID=134534 RepID=UPI003F5736B0
MKKLALTLVAFVPLVVNASSGKKLEIPTASASKDFCTKILYKREMRKISRNSQEEFSQLIREKWNKYSHKFPNETATVRLFLTEDGKVRDIDIYSDNSKFKKRIEKSISKVKAFPMPQEADANREARLFMLTFIEGDVVLSPSRQNHDDQFCKHLSN